ncbi:MAG: hypothetical protein RLY72_1859, partial [Planctomycetota bacterium]
SLQLSGLRGKFDLLLLQQREQFFLRFEIDFGLPNPAAEGTDLAVDSVKCQKIVKKRHRRVE